MFEFVRKHTRILQFVLVLLIFPSFVLFGLQGYERMSDGANATVATVGSRKITQAELDAAHRRQVDMIRQQQPGMDLRFLDQPEMKRNTLDNLVREQVMLTAAVKAGYFASDERLLREYMTDPQFDAFRRPDGSLDVQTLERALATQGLTKQGYDQIRREDIMTRQVQAGLSGSVIAPTAAVTTAMDAMFQQREVQLQRFDVKDYLGKVNPTDADLEAYYKDPSHSAEFQTPERADIEYVVLDLETISKSVSVAEDELRKYYAENEKNYTTAEERRAAHVFVKAPSSMAQAERAQARTKAEALLADLQKAPGSFAEVARTRSEDPSTASTGGDADLYIARGDTDRAYEEALFALQKPGDLSPVVETQDGFYVLQLKATRGGEKRSYESVRAEIEQERKRQLAQTEYAKAAADFGNIVYEQSDSLKPVVDKYKLELRTAKGVTRQPVPGAEGPLASPKLLEAIFSADSLSNKRNTEAVETAPSTLVSARIVKHEPAAVKPLEEVKAQVRAKVAEQQAVALARKEGEARLAELRNAPTTDLGTPVQVVSRAKVGEMPREVIDAVLRTSSVPGVEGVPLPGEGYVVARVTKVLGRDPAVGDPARASMAYQQSWAAAEAQAYYAALKRRFKVEVQEIAATPAN